MTRRFAWEHAFGLLGLALLLVGSFMGLFVAPAERHMGDVSRILYIHPPTAWISMLSFSAAFVFAIASLWSKRRRWDALLTGAIETGVVLTGLLLIQGSLWGRPTWGVWWDWDVRLTFSLIMLLLFTGIMALRAFVGDTDRRATWTAISTIIAYVDVPLVYFCVRWWRSLHQVQSSPETVDSAMVLPLRMNAFALLFLAVWFIARRTRLELARRSQQEVPEPERLVAAEGVS